MQKFKENMSSKLMHASFLLVLWALVGCTHAEKIAPSEIKSTETSVEILDLKWREDLKKIWSASFTNEFSDTSALDVLYFTNRTLRGSQAGCTDDQFGITPEATNMHTGICRINVPRNHVTGELKFTTDLRQASSDYFKFIGHKATTEADLIAYIKRSRRIPLVFVHGFNVKFQDAVLRSAQLAYDLKYQGPIVLFSWPAGAGDGFIDDKLVNVTYRNNKKSAESSVQVLKKFLLDLQNENLKVNLIVHSMGHQVVLPALNEIALDNSIANNKIFLNELILNAPDFELQQFPEIAENIKKISQRITLYCSYNDNAMVASEVFNKTKRLGACANVEGVDTINVSLIDAPTLGVVGLGHGYYSSRPILSDIFQVLIGLDAKKRLFIRDSEPNSTEKFYIRP